MTFVLILTLFVVSQIIFGYLQFATGFFSVRFAWQSAWLVLNGILGTVCLFALQEYATQSWYLILLDFGKL